MAKKLFAGSDAVDSILLIAKSTDNKLIQKANRLHNNYSIYEPWMSVPSGMIRSIAFPTETNLHGRFLTKSSLEKIKVFVTSLNPEGSQIPSLESYNLYVSNPEEELLKKFNSKIQESETELIRILPFFKNLIEQLIQFYLPMENPADQHEFDYGMSVMWLKGAIFFEKKQFPSLQRRVENLAHEIAHQIIINYQINDFLIDGDLNAKVYSGIRQSERPAIMALHGAAALSYMVMIARAYNDSSRVSELKDSLEKTLKSLHKISLTKVGRKIFEEMHEFL